MKLPIISVVFFLSLSQFSFATTSKPDSCPTIPALNAVGLTKMRHNNGFWDGGVQSANYGTKENWTFLISAFPAKDENEARDKAMKALSSLSLTKGPWSTGPEPISGIEFWFCSYLAQSGEIATAVTPTMQLGSVNQKSN